MLDVRRSNCWRIQTRTGSKRRKTVLYVSPKRCYGRLILFTFRFSTLSFFFAFRKALEMSCCIQSMLARILAEFEITLEQDVLQPLNKLSEVSLVSNQIKSLLQSETSIIFHLFFSSLLFPCLLNPSIFTICPATVQFMQ